MFNVTPFHTLEEELPPVISSIIPEGVVVRFEFGRFIAKKDTAMFEESLMVNLARSGNLDGFVTGLHDFLVNLANFISKTTKSEYPKLGDEPATFRVEAQGEQAIISLVTENEKHQRLGHVTYKPDYVF
jgi:hypothetical protein